MSQNPKYKIALKSPMHETSFWEEKNPTLLKGQIGIEISNEHGKLAKVGDGVHSWTNLPYINSIVGKKIAQHSEIFNDYENNETNIPYAHIEGKNNKANVKSFEIVGWDQFNYDKYRILIANAYHCESYYDFDLKMEAYNETFDIDLEPTYKYTWNVFRKEDGRLIKYRGIVESVELIDRYSNGDNNVILTLSGDVLPTYIQSTDDNTFLDRIFINGGSIGNREVDIDDMLESNFSIHIEGSENIGYFNTHTQGVGNKALGFASDAGGYYTVASGERSFTRGYKNIASGNESDAMGQQTKATGYCASTRGSGTTASGKISSAEGSGTVASGDESHSQGISTVASGRASTSMGSGTTASGICSTSTGSNTIASGKNSFVMGDQSQALGENSLAFGKKAVAYALNSIAGGNSSQAKGNNSIAIGNNCITEYENSIAIGSNARANWYRTFAFGENVVASLTGAFVTGINNTAGGKASFATGQDNIAKGYYSFVEGIGTHSEGVNAQHVQGTYNDKANIWKYAHIVGNGKSDAERSNAYTLDWNGNAWFAGNVTIKNNQRLATEAYVDDEITLIESDIYDINTEIENIEQKIESMNTVLNELVEAVKSLKSQI